MFVTVDGSMSDCVERMPLELNNILMPTPVKDPRRPNHDFPAGFNNFVMSARVGNFYAGLSVLKFSESDSSSAKPVPTFTISDALQTSHRVVVRSGGESKDSKELSTSEVTEKKKLILTVAGELDTLLKMGKVNSVKDATKVNNDDTDVQVIDVTEISKEKKRCTPEGNSISQAAAYSNSLNYEIQKTFQKKEKEFREKKAVKKDSNKRQSRSSRSSSRSSSSSGSSSTSRGSSANRSNRSRSRSRRRSVSKSRSRSRSRGRIRSRSPAFRKRYRQNSSDSSRERRFQLSGGYKRDNGRFRSYHTKRHQHSASHRLGNSDSKKRTRSRSRSKSRSPDYGNNRKKHMPKKI